jgi:hypothetical protein
MRAQNIDGDGRDVCTISIHWDSANGWSNYSVYGIPGNMISIDHYVNCSDGDPVTDE